MEQAKEAQERQIAAKKAALIAEEDKERAEVQKLHKEFLSKGMQYTYNNDGSVVLIKVPPADRLPTILVCNEHSQCLFVFLLVTLKLELNIV